MLQIQWLSLFSCFCLSHSVSLATLTLSMIEAFAWVFQERNVLGLTSCSLCIVLIYFQRCTIFITWHLFLVNGIHIREKNLVPRDDHLLDILELNSRVVHAHKKNSSQEGCVCLWSSCLYSLYTASLSSMKSTDLWIFNWLVTLSEMGANVQCEQVAC